MTQTGARADGGAGAGSDGDRSAITMYSTPWCGYCRRLKGQLDRAGIPISVVNIEDDPAAAELVMRVNNGNQTVPTLVFADGSALTNPSVSQVTQRLAAQG